MAGVRVAAAAEDGFHVRDGEGEHGIDDRGNTFTACNLVEEGGSRRTGQPRVCPYMSVELPGKLRRSGAADEPGR